MIKTISFALLAALLLLTAGPAPAADNQPAAVWVMGRAPAGASEAQTREAAIQDALRRAVSQACMEMLDPMVLRGRLDVLEREVLSRADRFVTSHTLQWVQRAGDGSAALVAVKLDRPALEAALGAAGLRQTGQTRALVLALVSEETGPGRPPAFWWGGGMSPETLPRPLLRAVASAGLPLVDARTLAGKVPPDYRQAVLNEEQALDLARKCGATMVLLGRLRTYPMLTPAGEEPPPLAQLEAMDVAGGKVLATEEASGPAYQDTPGPEAAEAVSRAGEEAVRRLLKQAMANDKPAQPAASAQQPSAPTPPAINPPEPATAAPKAPEPPAVNVPAAPPGEEQVATLELEGLRTLADLHRFEQVLRGLGDSVAQSQREALAGGGKATLRLKLKVPAARLAEQLAQQPYGDFGIKVLEVDQRRLRLTVLPR